MRKGMMINKTNQNIIGQKIWLADSFWSRFRGLLGHKPLEPGEGIWLLPCQQVHMFGMHFALSIWFLDAQGRVCQIIDELEPGKISPRVKNSDSILELPVGWGKVTSTKVGDEIKWQNLLE